MVFFFVRLETSIHQAGSGQLMVLILSHIYASKLKRKKIAFIFVVLEQI